MKQSDEQETPRTPPRKQRSTEKRQIQRFLGTVDELDLDAWEDEDELETFEPLPKKRKSYTR